MPNLLRLSHWGACRVSKLRAIPKIKPCKIDLIVCEMKVCALPFVAEFTHGYPLPIHVTAPKFRTVSAYIYKRLSNNNEIIKNQSSKFNGQFAEPGSRFGVRTAKSSEVPGRLEQDTVSHHVLHGLGRVATWT